MELLIAVDLAFAQLPDENPAGEGRFARGLDLKPELAQRDDRVALRNEFLGREGGDLTSAGNGPKELGHVRLARKIPRPRNLRPVVGEPTHVARELLDDVRDVAAAERLVNFDD